MTLVPAPTDRTLRVTTAVAAAVAIGIPAAVVATLGHELADGPEWVGLIACALGPLSLPLVWALAPRGFAIEGGTLRVLRPLAPVEIPLERIQRIGAVDDEAVRSSVRTFGVSGVFGNYGRFWSRTLGAFRLYARRSRGTFVLVEVEGLGRLVLAPADSEVFLEMLRFEAPRAGGISLARSTHARSRESVVMGMVPAVAFPVVIVVTVLLAAWAMAPASIAVRGNLVVIARRSAGDTELPIARLRAARPLAPAELHGLRRVAGTALNEVHYGIYRSDPLGRFRLYAHRSGPFVLLEGLDGRIVVTPDNPDRFLDEVQSRIAMP